VALLLLVPILNEFLKSLDTIQCLDNLNSKLLAEDHPEWHEIEGVIVNYHDCCLAVALAEEGLEFKICANLLRLNRLVGTVDFHLLKIFARGLYLQVTQSRWLLYLQVVVIFELLLDCLRFNTAVIAAAFTTLFINVEVEIARIINLNLGARRFILIINFYYH